MDRAETTLSEFCEEPGAASPPSTLVFVAHAGLEILGVGGRIASFPDRIHVAVLGDEASASAAADEARAALAEAGVAVERIHWLGGSGRSLLEQLERLIQDSASLMTRILPQALATHPYEGADPDQDLTACAVHVALERVSAGRPIRTPLIEFASGLDPSPQFRAPASRPERVLELDPEALAIKRTLVRRFESRPEWQELPLSVERYRIAPDYDFRRAPEVGPSRDPSPAEEQYLEHVRAVLAELDGPR